MNIMASDIIEFEVAFRPNSKPIAVSATVIGEDYFVCKLTQDSDDPRFWTADITEGYYQCTAAAAGDTGMGAGDFCDGLAYSAQF